MPSPETGAGQPAPVPTKPKAATPVTDVRTWAAIVIALVVIVGFGLMVWYLVNSANSSTDIGWQRLTFVFSGVQAIVFTAVGWLFGREVSKKQAETAQAHADSANEAEKAALTSAADLEARGNAAKAAIAARQARYNAAAEARTRGPAGEAEAGSASSPADDFDELATFMNALFPN